MSFTEKQITITVQLGQGAFGESGFNTVTLAGYRCSVQIERGLVPYAGHADVRIFGMAPSLMNQLSTLGTNPFLVGRLNIVTITAGDAENGTAQIFEGVIANGYQDYSGMPDVAFVIEAAPGQLDRIKPAGSTSYPGDVDVAVVLKSMAARMTPPLAFQNNGVKVILSTPYFCGCMLDQIRSAINAANINGEIHNGTLYIWPRNGTRPGASVVDISPENGLVGYPDIGGVQIFNLTTVFLPTLETGGFINLTSSLTPACGEWYVGGIVHRLESMTPGGAWFSDITAWSKAYQLAQPGF